MPISSDFRSSSQIEQYLSISFPLQVRVFISETTLEKVKLFIRQDVVNNLQGGDNMTDTNLRVYYPEYQSYINVKDVFVPMSVDSNVDLPNMSNYEQLHLFYSIYLD